MNFKYFRFTIIFHSNIASKTSIERSNTSFLLCLSDSSLEDCLSISLYFASKSIILSFPKPFLFHCKQDLILLLNQQQGQYFGWFIWQHLIQQIVIILQQKHIMNVLNKIKSKNNKSNATEPISSRNKSQLQNKNERVGYKQDKVEVDNKDISNDRYDKKSINKSLDRKEIENKILSKVNKSKKKQKIISDNERKEEQIQKYSKKPQYQFKKEQIIQKPSLKKYQRQSQVVQSNQKKNLNTKIENRIQRDNSGQFSDDLLSNRSSLLKIVSISKQYKWANPQYECQKYQQFKNSKTGTQTEQIQKKKQKQKIPTQYAYMLVVKKGFQIGRMSIFEGILEKKKVDNQNKTISRTRQPIISKISCKIQLVPNPESISHIYLNKIVEIGDKQYLVGDNGIVKVTAKSRPR